MSTVSPAVSTLVEHEHEACFYCNGDAFLCFSCPQCEQTSGVSRYMLCRCCRKDACKFCDYAAQDKDCLDDSDLPSKSGSRLTQYTDPTSGLPIGLGPIMSTHGTPITTGLHYTRPMVVLFDLHYTLVHVQGDTTGQVWNMLANDVTNGIHVHIRPFARDLLDGILQQQRAGNCRVGIYTPMSPLVASSVACKLLCETIGQAW